MKKLSGGFFCVLSCFAIHANLALAAAPALTWNGASGDIWDATTANWLDSGNTPTAWQPGSEACFAGAGGLVNIAEDVDAAGITFAANANGYTLLGRGRLSVEGAIATDAAATTNSIAADLIAYGGVAKTGPGALALARCAGPLAVQAGTLLAAGSLFKDADVSVAAGASLVTLGETDPAENLLLNSGFEDPVRSDGSWAYQDIPDWTRAAYPGHIGIRNTIGGTEWTYSGISPEGVQMAILQGGAVLSQTVTVPEDGLYAVAFHYLMRMPTNNRTNMVYVSLNNMTLSAFVNRSSTTEASRFASGAVWLPAGDYTLSLAGEADHGWADCTTLLDDVNFAPISGGGTCHAFGGDSTLALVTGASAVLSHSDAAAATLVTLDGTAVPGGTTYTAGHGSGIFSGPGSLVARPPENVFTQTAPGAWPVAGGADLLLRLNADTANTAPAEFTARRIQLFGDGTLSGTASTFANAISQPLPGTWTVTAPLAGTNVFMVENTGDLTFTQPLTLTPSNGLFVKTGPGTLTLAADTNIFGSAYIYGGTVEPAAPDSALSWELYSSDNTPAALRLTNPGIITRRINFYGHAFPTLAIDAHGTVTNTDWMVAFGSNPVLDVADGSTFSIRQLIRSRLSNSMTANPTLLKTGPGTLEIRSAGANNDTSRAYSGGTVLRNGTIIVHEDDWGTLENTTNPFNGRAYTGIGGSLGYSLLTNAVIIGDAATDPADDLALIAAGHMRWIGHDIEVFDAGNTVTLGMTTGTTSFAGSIILHRDITLVGAADANLILETVAIAPGATGTFTPAFTGLASLTVNGSLPADTALHIGPRHLNLGTRTVKAQTLTALTLGGAPVPGGLDVDFGGGENDVIHVTAPDGLTLGATTVNLYYAGSDRAFAEPGTYTLFTYAGTLNGAPATALTLGNRQTGMNYAFADDTANGRVTLTITGLPVGVDAVWISKDSGDWDTLANWESAAVPDAPGAIPLFGTAITNPATVNIPATRTVGGILFDSAAHSYTLSGTGGLTLDAGGATPLIDVIAGTHTLNTTLTGTDGIDITAAPGTALALGTDATVAAALTLSQGTLELRGAATVTAPVTLAPGTLLRTAAAADAAIGTLTVPAAATLALTGAASALTVNQTAADTFYGTLTGAASATLTKAGPATLTLDNLSVPFSGTLAVKAGTLALKPTAMPGAAAITAPGTLEIIPPAANGLIGYFYNIAAVTNNFFTLAAMEAHFATVTPDFAALSSDNTDTFDFGTGSPYIIAGEYASAGSRPENYEVLWRGSITVPASGSYVFGCYGDDGYLLAIDGQQVLNRPYWNASWCEGTVTLAAGRHDITIGYFQRTGGGGIRLQVRLPGTKTPVMLPNTWLSPYTQTGALSGSGTLALPAAGALLRTTAISGGSIFGGTLSGIPGTQFTKAGAGILSLADTSAAGAFTGDIGILAGVLAINSASALAPAARLSIQPGATLAIAGTETALALAGAGTLALGAHIYVVPFTDDADCDITPAKTYTHLLDFPANGNPATVNGVLFTAAGATGPNWAFTGAIPNGSWNTAEGIGNDAARQGIDRLTWDFQHGAQGASTLTLTGLTPGRLYETRFYFRNYNNNNRNLDFTLTADQREVARLSYNPDTGAGPKGSRSWLACRYTADAAGSIAITVTNRSTADTCHFYGLTNEELNATPGTPALTLTPAADAPGTFTGTATGSGTLTLDGPGEQRFSGALTLAPPLDIRAGTATLIPGATLTGGAAISAGATLKVPLGCVTLGSLSGAGTFELTASADYADTTAPGIGNPRFVPITGDADSGISPHKIYTHLIDFGSSTALATVNGVPFNKETASNGPTFGYSWSGAPFNTSPHAGGNTENIGVPSADGIYALLNDFCYGGTYGTMRITGLTIGKTYEVRFYHRKWASAARGTLFTFDPDGAGPISDPIEFDPDRSSGSFNDNYLAYRYLAATNHLAVTITPLNSDKYHMYGFSNEEVPASLDGATTLDIAADTQFSGTVTGVGALAKTGPGTLTLAGQNETTGPLTVREGTLAIAGARAYAGSVHIAGGWFRAGSERECGTLAIGGDLILAPGTILPWRYSSAAADHYAVAGIATFPAEGVLRLTPLSTGLPAPARRPVVTSLHPIDGPADLTGWIIDGDERATLRYNADRTEIYFSSPRGTLLLLL